MKNAGSLAILILFSINLTLTAQTGAEIFKNTCSTCHTINKGRLIGPDLAGIYNKRDNEWLLRFIRSSQEMIKSGDPDAVAIFNEYNKIPMPDNNLTDQQIQSVIDFIRETEKGPAGEEKAVKTDTMAMAADSTVAADSIVAISDTVSVTQNMLQAGNNLYYGYLPFVNGASPCVSCHNIDDPSFLGGGRLAFDLTGAYTKLRPEGITAILMNPPFPAMKSAIPGQLTDEEIAALNSLLKSVAIRSSYIRPLPGGMIFFLIGFVCAMFIIVFTIIFYDDRKIPDGNFFNK